MLIETSEKYLSFKGLPQDAMALVDSVHEAFEHSDMPKVLNDFIFNLEVALQDDGWLDQDFNVL